MYLAHKSEDGFREQSIEEHLTNTADLAADFAEAFGCREWGYGIGLLHDVGKYSEAFQKRLQGGPITDHATAGAKEAGNPIAAYCISGHHSGLLNGGTLGDAAGEATLMGRLKKEVEDYHAFRREIQKPSFSCPSLRPLDKGGFGLSFFTRMLFSCLVDADFLDTEAFMSMNQVKRDGYDSIETLYERLSAKITPWLGNTDNTTVNGRRTAILRACLEMGKEQKGLYQLTVPTGGGKTISSLAFALEHAKKHHCSRIIYVIPYTSIIEQNAQIFKDILGKNNVLEDHCNVTYESQEELSRYQLAAENWDKPVVVTTNVQFFESLFSNKVSKCRKLHNLANSIVIFDEAQMLPVKYLKPCIQAISELVYNYRCTAVLCTATQPALQQFFPSSIKAKEICPDVEGQYRFFQRTLVEKKGEFSEEELVDRLKEREQVLCILNSRRRVQRIYEMLPGEENFHLSTFMYPAHRKRIMEKVRARLKERRACRLIATSLVEAGVDFDFQMVFRELAGIDSVIQAAGRCNREGKNKKEDCLTEVFTLEAAEDIHLPNELKQPIAVAEQIAEKYEDISSLEAIAEYFNRLYYLKGEGLDAKDIIGQLEKGTRSCLFPFAEIAKQFKLIESNTKTILIDKEPEASALAEKLRRGEYSRQLVREAGQYCVNLFEKDFEALNGAGRLEQIAPEFYVLRNKEQYTEERGLIMDVSRGDALLF